MAVNVAGISSIDDLEIEAFSEKACQGTRITGDLLKGSSMASANLWAVKRLHFSGQANDAPVSLLIKSAQMMETCIDAFALEQPELHRIQPQYGMINGTYNGTLPDVYRRLDLARKFWYFSRIGLHSMVRHTVYCTNKIHAEQSIPSNNVPS